MASRIAVSVSANVVPVATQPGRSGTYAEKFEPAFSMTTAYRIAVTLISSQAGLLEDTVERARCQIVAGLARNGHPASLGGMLELTMATANCDKEPPIIMQQTEQGTHFHPPTLPLAPFLERSRAFARD